MAKMTNEKWAKVAVGVAHYWWDCCGCGLPEDDEHAEAEHDRWVAIAERCYEGTLTDEDRRELAEWHAEMSEEYECDEWYED